VDRNPSAVGERDGLSAVVAFDEVPCPSDGRGIQHVEEHIRLEREGVLLGRHIETLLERRGADLRQRCGIVLWQELAAAAPEPLREFLALKYGLCRCLARPRAPSTPADIGSTRTD
jgi:hypothetical protein